MNAKTDKELHNYRFYTESEHDAAYAINNGFVASKFRIIEFKGVDRYNQYCFDVHGKKLRITSSEYNKTHCLANALSQEIRTLDRISQWDLFFFLKNQEYVYDRYYDSLIEPSDIVDKVKTALSDFPLAKDEILLVKGEYTDCRPLLYCLQERFLRVIVIPKYELTPINFKDSFMTPLALNAKIETTPQASPADYIDDWSPAIFVPLVEGALNSNFYGNLTWRDILPENPKKDFDLGEFPIVSVWIRFDYDAQGQIYVTARYAGGEEIRLNTSKPAGNEEANKVIEPSPVPVSKETKPASAQRRESDWINITEVTSYYKKEDLERRPTSELQKIKDEILRAYKQFDYIYTDTNVWVENKVVEKQGKRYVATPNLISIEQLTNMMPDLGSIHYLHQYVYDEIEIMQKGIHKERFEHNSGKRRDDYIASEKLKVISSGCSFDSDEYERAFNEWKGQYHYEERLQREDDLKVAANRAIETYKKLKKLQEERRAETGLVYFIREGADFDNKVRDLDDASNAADREISRSIIEFYKQGKKVLLITNDEGMWSTLGDVREMNSLIPGTGIPNPDMPPQDNIARLKSYNLKGHMMALSNIDKILSSR